MMILALFVMVWCGGHDVKRTLTQVQLPFWSVDLFIFFFVKGQNITSLLNSKNMTIVIKYVSYK